MCGAVKDSTGEDSTQESPDTNQAEIVTTATGKNAKLCDQAAASSLCTSELDNYYFRHHENQLGLHVMADNIKI